MKTRPVRDGTRMIRDFAVCLKAAFSRMEPERSREYRFGFIGLCLVGLFVAVGVKMTIMATPERLESDGTSKSVSTISSRGKIYDRNGQLLAVNVPGYAIYAHPHEVHKEQVDDFLGELSKINPKLAHNHKATRKRLLGNGSFTWISTKISGAQSQIVNRIAIEGVYTGQREVRVYPNGPLAAHVLGGVRFGEQHANKAEIVGIAGVEQYFNDLLNDSSSNNRDLYLSIDLQAQEVITKLLRSGVSGYGAKGGSAILMNVHTGEVLAMASLPDFDPNRRGILHDFSEAGPSPLFNKAVQGVYEMGSTFKLFSTVQAIDQGFYSSESVISVDPITVRNKTFRDKRSHAPMPLTEALARSKNTAAVRLAAKVGKKSQRAFYVKLGFGRKTAIELPEKARPLFPSALDWNDLTMATVSFGHGISITPLHLASAYAMMVNGGKEIHPTVLISKGATGQNQVITSSASKEAVKLLQGVVETGTAREAAVSGYGIGGKTGTSEKIDADGEYREDRNRVIFASAFAGDNPNFVLVVMLDEASAGEGIDNPRQAGNTVVPLAGEMISRLIPVLELKPIAKVDEPVQLALN